MKNKYVEYISDEHFLKCIENLYSSYEKAKAKISKKKFYNNKIDTIKLAFDSRFNMIDEKVLLKRRFYVKLISQLIILLGLFMNKY